MGNITVDMVRILMIFVITQRLYLLNILVYIVLHVVFVKVLGGMRGMTGLLWETSLLDADEVWL